MKPLFSGEIAGAGAVSMDAGALTGLRQQAQRAPKEALSAAASQFEALFVQNLLKAMRKALPQDGPLASDSMRAYTGMFDAQLAQEISRRGLGLGKMLERQLGSTLQTDASGAPTNPLTRLNPGRADATGAVRSLSAPDATTPTFVAPGATAPGLAKPGSLKPGFTAPAAITSSSNTQPSVRTSATAALRYRDITFNPAATASTVRSTGKVPDHVRAFVDTMRPHAEAAARKVGVPADVLLAQAGLETGWGRHQPQSASGNVSHNLLGIKAGSRWTGATVLARTSEYVAGAITRTIEKFRSYASYADAFADFGKLITGNARYAEAVANVNDSAAYARGLQKGGYATDPRYADKLTQAIALVGHVNPAVAAPQVLAGVADNRITKA